ncbi:MAG: hypothetical protein ACRYFZ_23210 [Janthinobacterium lividum]
MPEYPDTIDQTEYDQYTAAWATLLTSGSAEDLAQAFGLPGVGRITFLTFSLDQLLALVSAAEVRHIKARLLLLPDTLGVPRFGAALFATDADDTRLTDYYIPTPTAATSTQTVEPATGPSTSIPREETLDWLTSWLTATALATAQFTTPYGPLQGSNFQVSTFQDPLAAAPPYADQSLFFNLGLHASGPGLAQTLAPVVYISALTSRTQGTIEGIPIRGGFYDMSMPAPPAP